jgi:putative adenylate-forming enzyme
MEQRREFAKAYIASRFRRFRSRATLEAWQERKVVDALRRILPLSRFYRERLGKRDVARWREMAPIDKQVMMDNFDILNTRGLRRAEVLELAMRAEETRDFSPMIEDLTVGLSSGTSGNKGLFVASPRERAWWAGCMLARALPGSLLDVHRVALFLRAGSNLYSTLDSRRIAFRFFDLIKPVDDHLGPLQAFSPTVLAAPPSMLRFLAEAQHRGDLSILPRKVISVAEVLDPVDEEIIRQAFGQLVHQIYQCTEGFLGVTCAHGTLHLNEDIAVIEKDYLDKALRTFSPVITDFRRFTQPVIRYRLDDVLTEREELCACGSLMTAIEMIEGRCDDVFYLPCCTTGAELIPVFPDFVRRAVMTSSDSVRAYTVRQLTPEQWQVGLIVDGPREQAEAAVTQGISALCARVGVRSPTIVFSPVDVGPGPAKLKRVERCFDPRDQRPSSPPASISDQ